jgi:hypothetical protein
MRTSNEIAGRTKKSVPFAIGERDAFYISEASVGTHAFRYFLNQAIVAGHA